MIGEARLLERERELASLEGLLERARAGRGGVAVIEGEPGVGKSRLLLEARLRAERFGMRVLWARASELECGYAFGVAAQLLGERLVAEALDPGDRAALEGQPPLAAILALYDSLLELACGVEAAPVLAVIDDAQWADEPSLRFLAHVVLRIEAAPVALVAAVRLGEADSQDELLYRLREAPSVRVLTPAALSEDAVCELVRATLGEGVDQAVVAACHRASAGNPFYLRELLRALAVEGAVRDPERVGELAPRAVLRSIVVRLARLGAPAAALARAAAVLGDGTRLALAGPLAGLGQAEAGAAADVLAGAGILRAGEALVFSHPLIATALEADMGAFERAREHRRAAELLIARSAPAEQIAAQLLLTEPQGDRRAVAVLEDAAARALSKGSPAVAAGLLERALSEPPASEDQPRVLLSCAKAWLTAGSTNAEQRLEQAVGLTESGEERAAVLAELAQIAFLRWDLAGAVELASGARSALPSEHPLAERLLGVELSASALHPELREEAVERLRAIAADARAGKPPSDPRLLALAVGQLAIQDSPELVRSLAERLIADDPLIDDSHGTSLGWVAGALEWVDELELAERWLDDAVEQAGRCGAVIAGSTARLNRARVRYLRGRLAGAIEDGEHALEIYRYGWTSSPWSTPVLAMAQAAIGELDAAREALATGRRAGSHAADHGRLLEAEARLQLARADAAAALECARAAGEIPEDRYGLVEPRVWEWRRLAAMAAHRLGDDAQARELIEPDLDALRAIGPARQLAQALTAAGLATGGRSGVELLREAADLLDSSPARLQRAETLLELGAALRRVGSRGAAKAPLYEALELAASMNAAPLERQARAELGRLGLRPRRTAQSGVASLTDSERQVAQLAAEGLSTPQIAAQLHVSRSTVETHLHRVYQKLDLSGRGDLRDALSEPVQAR